MQRRKTELAPLKGQKWRQTHQATIDAILGPNVREVVSRGTAFYNKDNWTARAFADALCEWARLNPGQTPIYADVDGFVYHANRLRVSEYEKGIVIASTPDDLPKGLAFALVGGGYHEAWHTEYSRRDALSASEMWAKISALWPLIPFQESETGWKGWAGLTGPLLEWSNIVEDIRIERLGCRKYPGSQDKMEALQDLILRMEEEGLEAAAAKGRNVNSDLAVVMGAFRDLGLGYKTPRQTLVLSQYKERSPGAWRFVTEGPLAPLLERAINLGVGDDVESLWLAMEIVAAIAAAAPSKKQAPKKPQPEEEKEEEDVSEDEEEKQDADGEEGNPDEENEETPEQGEESSGDDTQEGEGEESEDGESEPDDSDEPGPAGSDICPPSDKTDGSRTMVWQTGDRSKLKTGPHAGREVEVTKAGLPDENGVQELFFALVEED